MTYQWIGWFVECLWFVVGFFSLDWWQCRCRPTLQFRGAYSNVQLLCGEDLHPELAQVQASNFPVIMISWESPEPGSPGTLQIAFSAAKSASSQLPSSSGWSKVRTSRSDFDIDDVVSMSMCASKRQCIERCAGHRMPWQRGNGCRQLSVCAVLVAMWGFEMWWWGSLAVKCLLFQ